VAERRKKYSTEFKEEAARMVVESGRPIAEVARELGIHDGTLGNWVGSYRREHGDDEELERENRELRMKSEFLGKAAAFFAGEYR
jgi:transposase-like protein